MSNNIISAFSSTEANSSSGQYPHVSTQVESPASFERSRILHVNSYCAIGSPPESRVGFPLGIHVYCIIKHVLVHSFEPADNNIRCPDILQIHPGFHCKKTNIIAYFISVSVSSSNHNVLNGIVIGNSFFSFFIKSITNKRTYERIWVS
jgi:hypothetical protein